MAVILTFYWTMFAIGCFLFLLTRSSMNPSIIPIEQAILVATPIQIREIETWYDIESTLFNQLKTNRSSEWTIATLSTFADSIRRHYPYSLDSHHQKSLSMEYCVVMMECRASTKGLIQILRMMMDQNKKLGLRLDHNVWNSFFTKFRRQNDIDSPSGMPLIEEFNGLLGDLMGYFVSVSMASPEILQRQQHLIERLFARIWRTGTFYNLETYEILARLGKRYKLSFRRISQPAFQDPVNLIVRRMYAIYQTERFLHSRKVPQTVLDQAMRRYPDPSRRYTKEEWGHTLAEWRGDIHIDLRKNSMVTTGTI